MSLFYHLLAQDLYSIEYQEILKAGVALEEIVQENVLPSIIWKTKQDVLLRKFKSIGALDRMDLILFFNGDGNSDFKCINWATPGVYQATKVNSPGFSEFGVKGDGVSKYIETNFNQFSHSVKATQNSNSFAIGIASDQAADSTKCAFGLTNGTTSSTQFFSRLSTGNVSSRNNCGAADTAEVANATRIGRYIGRRTSSTAHSLCKNGSQIAEDTTSNSAAFQSLTFQILKRNLAASPTFSDETIQYFIWGDFGDLQAEIDAALATYLS